MYLLPTIYFLYPGWLLAGGTFLPAIPFTACLWMIARQDYSTRTVQWIWFPLLALGGVLLGLTGTGIGGQPMAGWRRAGSLPGYAGINFLFLLVQFIALTGYFTLRYGIRPSVFREKIGAGDLCFLLAACCCFSPLNFILFYISSLLFSVLACVTGRLLKRPFGRSIPLAGLQASFLLLLLWVSLLLDYSLTSDDLLLSKIVRL